MHICFAAVARVFNKDMILTSQHNQSIKIEPGHEKTCLMSYANSKSQDQPAPPRSLISAFIVRCLDSEVSLVSVTKISSPMLASVAEQAGLSLTWSETPKTAFLVTRLS